MEYHAAELDEYFVSLCQNNMNPRGRAYNVRIILYFDANNLEVNSIPHVLPYSSCSEQARAVRDGTNGVLLTLFTYPLRAY